MPHGVWWRASASMCPTTSPPPIESMTRPVPWTNALEAPSDGSGRWLLTAAKPSGAALLHDGRHPAVHVQQLPVDEVRRGGGEEQQRPDELVRPAPARRRRAPPHPRVELLVRD